MATCLDRWHQRDLGEQVCELMEPGVEIIPALRPERRVRSRKLEGYGYQT